MESLWFPMSPTDGTWLGGSTIDRTVCGGGLQPGSATYAVDLGAPTLPGYAACGCYVGPWMSITPPPRCAAHADGHWPVPMVPFVPEPPWPIAPKQTPVALTVPTVRIEAHLSDADVDRIARRVVELLREAKP